MSSVCDPAEPMHSLWQATCRIIPFAPAPQSRFDGEWDEMDMVPFARLDGRASSAKSPR